MTKGSMPRVLITALEPVRPDSAPEIHLDAMASGFRVRGWEVARSWRTSARNRFLALVVDPLRTAWAARGASFVYSRWHVLAMAQYVALTLFRKPYILELNGTLDDIVIAHRWLRPFRPILRGLARWQFRRAAAIVSVTRGFGEWALRLANRSIPLHVAPNGASSQLASMHRSPGPDRYVVFLGELAPWQGVDCLLTAYESSEWPSGVRLVVIGDGALAPVVRHAVKSGVIFRGRLERSAAMAELAGALASVSPQSARFERNRLGVSAVKVSESILLGVPPVVSDLPGQGDLVKAAPAGATFAPDDPIELSRAVARAVKACDSDRAALSRYGELRVSWEVIAAEAVSFCEHQALAEELRAP